MDHPVEDILKLDSGKVPELLFLDGYYKDEETLFYIQYEQDAEQ